MGFPGEEIVSTAIEKFSEGVIQKMEESEARRDRELSTLKREILGQNITPLTIIQVLITDYFEKSDLVNESRCYVEGKMKELFPDEQII